MTKSDPLKEIKDGIERLESAQANLQGYEDGTLPLPNNMFDRYETCLLQKDVVKRLFNEVLFAAMALERVNALPVELSEKIAEIRI